MSKLETRMGALLLSTVLSAGCVLASPTYVTSTEAPPGADASVPAPPTTSTVTSGPAGPGAPGACTQFAKPNIAALPPCGNGLGHCYAKVKVPFAEQFAPCPNAADVCVPDDILNAAGGKLKPCTSIIGPGGCATAALIPELAKQGGSVLKQDVCGAGQLCAPCNDPTNGNAPTPFCQPIGVYADSCTAPPTSTPAPGTTPPGAGAPPCCAQAGICIASTAIPEAQRDDTIQDTCLDGQSCVPAEFAKGTSRICNAGGGSRGVCLSTCFDGLMELASFFGFLSRSTCFANEVCIPCSQVAGQGVPNCP